MDQNPQRSRYEEDESARPPLLSLIILVLFPFLLALLVILIYRAVTT